MARADSSYLKAAGYAAVIALALGCGDRARSVTTSTTGGTVVIAATGDPDVLFPPLATNVPARQVTELIYDYLADIGTSLNVIGDAGFTPKLADRWRWSADSLSISFHLNAKARWHDGAPVRSNDVVFTHDLYTSPRLGNPMTEELKSIDSVTAPDSLTNVFWFHARSPEQFFTAVSMMLILPQHVYGKLGGDSLRERASRVDPVGSGRFRFVRWTQGSSLEVAADTGNYRGRPPLDRVVWSVSPDYLGALTKLNGGEADVFDALHADNVQQVAANPNLRVITLPGMDYAFLQFNLKDPSAKGASHPIFGSREMRRALTMAIDRDALVKNVFDTLGAVSVGPTIRALPTTSKSLVQIPYDTVRAAAILDSLGWKGRTRDGVRTRNGRELAFTMIVPASSSARNRMAVLIQSQLKRAGVRADIDKMEYQAFADREGSRNFDATFGAWHVTADPSAVREVWTTSASRRKEGRNYGSYENPSFDALLDSAAAATEFSSGVRLYTRAYQLIVDDAPAVWLYEPKLVIGLQKRLVTRGLTPGSWWAGLGTWSIPPSERIQRDIGGVRR
ncbi:MAG: peptide ABC transporter substrate-binding protein [Gemmatimonadota bacterium]|nr:peptide ABC transporter substrate-binding protein [Gemmatimonadota bacterium]